MRQTIAFQGVPFTQVANVVLNDKRLSLKAKGLFAYLYSKPDGYDFSFRRIAQDCADGEKAVLSAIKELEGFGYLIRQKQPSGRTSYFMTFEPSAENGYQPKRLVGKTGTISKTDNESKKEEDNNTDSVTIVTGENVPHGTFCFCGTLELYDLQSVRRETTPQGGTLVHSLSQCVCEGMEENPSVDGDAEAQGSSEVLLGRLCEEGQGQERIVQNMRQKSTSSSSRLSKAAGCDLVVPEASHGKASEIAEVIHAFKEINPTINFGNKTQRSSAEVLVQKFGLEKVLAMVSFALSIQGDQYAPVITTPYELQQKLGKLVAYKTRQDSKPSLVATI